MLNLRRLSLWTQESQEERGVAVYSYVYFISAGDVAEDGTPVKIGYSGTDPVFRLASIQQGHYAKLTLVLAVPGDRGLERAIHEGLEEDRIRGEWFRSSQTLRILIATMGNGPEQALEDLRQESLRFFRDIASSNAAG